MADFDPGPSVYNLIASGYYDGYVLKLNQDITTGVLEKKIQNILIYPNPVKNVLTIKKNIKKTDKIRIIDLTGKTIKTIESNSNKIDVSSLLKGIYFLEITTNDSVLVQKLIKE